jgi:hypothetical protein
MRRATMRGMSTNEDPKKQGQEWDEDAVDLTGELDELGETRTDDDVVDRIEGGEDPLNNNDRLTDA